MLKGHSSGVTGVSFSPDGELIASAGQTIKLWKPDGNLVNTLEGQFTGGSNSVVSFSPDGKLVAAASWDKTAERWAVKLWNLDGTLFNTLGEQSPGAISVSFSPDGKLLASANADKTIKLWNLNLDDLLVRGCNLMHTYLNNPNANLNDNDRHLCDGISTHK